MLNSRLFSTGSCSEETQGSSNNLLEYRYAVYPMYSVRFLQHGDVHDDGAYSGGIHICVCLCLCTCECVYTVSLPRWDDTWQVMQSGSHPLLRKYMCLRGNKWKQRERATERERGEKSVWLAVAPSSCRCRGACQRCPDLSVSVNVLHSSHVQVRWSSFLSVGVGWQSIRTPNIKRSETAARKVTLRFQTSPWAFIVET